MHVTVAICTWNRAKLLDQTLSEMRKLRVPDGVTWEVLVVNNKCTDDTDAVLERHAPHLPLRRLLEVRQGQSFARNCAVAAASGELIVWTDDDVLVESGWLAAYVSAAAVAPQDVAFFGGAVTPWFETPPVPAMAAALPAVRSGFCGVTVPEELSIAGESPVLPVGANCAMRRAAIVSLEFNTELGAKGAEHVTGEEWQLMRRLLSMGYTGRWVPGAEVRHFVPAERLRLRSVFRFFHGLGAATIVTEGVPVGRRLCGVPLWMIRKVVQTTLSLPLAATMGRWESFYRAFAQTGSLSGRIAECWRRRGAERPAGNCQPIVCNSERV
jgi:hypothetical protein